MGVTQIFATQEYTHKYRMWKSITANERTWVCFRGNLQYSYLDKEKLEKTAVAAGCSSANNVKHGEIEDAFMNFASATAENDAAFTELTKTTGNMSTQLRLQEDHIWAIHVELCNLKLASETQTTERK